MIGKISAIQQGLLLILAWSAIAADLPPADPPPAKTAAVELEDALEVLRATDRRKVAEELLKCDSVEICRFETRPGLPSQPLHIYNWDPFSSYANSDLFGGKKEEEWFPVPFFSKSFKIISKVTLTGAQKEEFKASFRKLLIDPGDSIAACYNPHHGVRFYEGDVLVLEADICVECFGFSLHYPGRVSSLLIPLRGNSIQPLLLKLLPLPEEK